MEFQVFKVQESFMNKTADYIRIHKYEILLCSFLLLIFGNTVSNKAKLAEILNIYQNIITGAIVFYNRKRLRNIIVGLIVFSLFLEIYQNIHPFTLSRSLHNTIYLIFFSLVSFEVYKVLLYAKTVTRELLSAALCGFVLLCLISTFLCYELEASHPHSFSNVGTTSEALPNLNYFSFVTLLIPNSYQVGERLVT